jgi:hypothetical protein
MEPRALTASSGLAPWSMALDRTSAAQKKNPTAHGGSRELAHIGLPPLMGERGVTLANFTPLLKKLEGISTEPNK